MGEVVHASWICSSGAELHTVIRVAARERRPNGAMAQLVARFHGMEEVGGSNPPSSTVLHQQALPSGEGRFVSLLAAGKCGTMRIWLSLCWSRPWEPSSRS